MLMDPLRICVVGVGALGRHHARILSQMAGVELVAVADPRPEQGQSVAEACGCPWVEDYRTLLDRVDAASIVVPTSLHERVAVDFLRRGIPLLIEKPLAATVREAQTLVRLADANRAVLQVGHIERFNPTYQKVAELTGPPKYIRAERLSPYAFRSMDIGVVHDVMIHDVDLVLSLVGATVDSVEAFGMSLLGGLEDCVQARLRFANGCIADLVANRVHPTPRRALQVWSASGCITADLHQRTLAHFRPGADLQSGLLPFELAQAGGADVETLKQEVFGRFLTIDEPEIAAADALTAELSSFINAVQTGRPPHVDGHQALRALEVAERILEAVGRHAWDGSAAGRIGPHAHAIHHRERRAG